MSGRTRSSKPKSSAAPAAPPSPTLSASVPHRSQSRRSEASDSQWSLPTTNDSKAAIMREYGQVYDSVNRLKEAIIGASNVEEQSVVGHEFWQGLVRQSYPLYLSVVSDPNHLEPI